MFTILNEISAPSLFRLSVMRKAVLLNVYVAPSPAVGYERTLGSEYIVTAADFLLRAGLIDINSNAASITHSGFDVLSANGLIDTSGDITDEGAAIIRGLDRNTKRVFERMAPFKIIKSLKRIELG